MCTIFSPNYKQNLKPLNQLLFFFTGSVYEMNWMNPLLTMRWRKLIASIGKPD